MAKIVFYTQKREGKKVINYEKSYDFNSINNKKVSHKNSLSHFANKN
jgi:hypothetical protein